MLLRDVTEGDAAAIAQLITEFTNLTTTAAEVQRRLVRSRGIEHPILAELDGSVAGFASLRLVNYLGADVPYAEISELFVSEHYRRQGIARALMAELERRARAAGASSMAILTAADNDTAKHFIKQWASKNSPLLSKSGSRRTVLTEKGRSSHLAQPCNPMLGSGPFWRVVLGY